MSAAGAKSACPHRGPCGRLCFPLGDWLRGRQRGQYAGFQGAKANGSATVPKICRTSETLQGRCCKSVGCLGLPWSGLGFAAWAGVQSAPALLQRCLGNHPPACSPDPLAPEFPGVAYLQTRPGPHHTRTRTLAKRIHDKHKAAQMQETCAACATLMRHSMIHCGVVVQRSCTTSCVPFGHPREWSHQGHFTARPPGGLRTASTHHRSAALQELLGERTHHTNPSTQERTL